MTREESKKAAEVMMAYAEGKDIEFKAYGDEQWKTFRHGKDRFLCFNFDKFEYRIKEEPTYRPFKNAKECWTEMHKHSDFGWIVNGIYYQGIDSVTNNSIYIGTLNESCTYKKALNEFTFVDGTPFGIKEE